MVAWKEVEPFIGLIGATIILVGARQLLHVTGDGGRRKVVVREDENVLSRKKAKAFALTLGLVFGFMLFLAALAYLQLPKYVGTTHAEVVKTKAQAREKCDALILKEDILGAETWIRDNSLSKRLATEFESKQLKTLDRALRPFTNALFFRTGTFFSVLPIFLTLVIEIALARFNPKQGSGAKPRFLPSEADYAFLFLPLLYSTLATTWVATAGFHFWLREHQVTSCMLISGHWYTASHTVFAFIFNFVMLRFEINVPAKLPGARRYTRAGSMLGHAYIAYLVLYLALVSRSLGSSQRFHHDTEESVEGMWSMLKILPFSAMAGIFGFVAGLENAYVMESASDSSSKGDQGITSEKESDELITSESALLKKNAVCKIAQDFLAEGEDELTAKAESLLRVVGDGDTGGWVHVENTSGVSGFVPTAYLEPTNQPFKPQVSSPVNKGAPTMSVPAKTATGAAEPKKATIAPARTAPSFLADIATGGVKLSKPSKSRLTPPPQKAGGMFSELQERLVENRAQITGKDDGSESSENDDSWEDVR